MLIADKWKDYELIDIGQEERLERWGKYIVRRPDPQAIWVPEKRNNFWEKADAVFVRGDKGGGKWKYQKALPERWTVTYEQLKFYVKPMGFKHMGIFPEQAANWDWMMALIRKRKEPVNVLSLFAYTGGATLACAYAGASVCHVDAAKGIVQRARENQQLSGLGKTPVRWIVDDVLKFVKREIKRGRQYDAVVMDPPSYGKGPKGEVWQIETHLDGLVQDCLQLLSPKPLFFLINSYTTGLSPTLVGNLLQLNLVGKYGGKVSSGEIGLPVSSADIIMPCGNYGRWEYPSK